MGENKINSFPGYLTWANISIVIPVFSNIVVTSKSIGKQDLER